MEDIEDILEFLIEKKKFVTIVDKQSWPIGRIYRKDTRYYFDHTFDSFVFRAVEVKEIKILSGGIFIRLSWS